MRKIVSLLVVLMLGTVLAFAQTRPITGRVLDEAGQPVSGASVTIRGTRVGASADAEGNFRINAKAGDVLMITSAGHLDKQVTVGAESTINVVLPVQAASLAEVVVSAGYNTRRTQRSTVSNAQVVSSEQLTTIRPTNINNALAGKVAGIQVRSQSSAALGRDANIRLRGEANLGGGSLLYIVDGTVTNSVDINPDDVEDVTVLNGPSGAAIYGPQAANGVMVITTKKARRGQRGIGVEVNTGYQWDKVYILPNYQNEYAGGDGDLRKFNYTAGMPAEWQPLDGKYYHDYSDDASWGPRMAGQEYIPWYSWYPGTKYTGTTAKLLPQPNNARQFFNTGVTGINNINFSKAGEGYNARVSYTNFDVKGLIPNSDLTRHNLSTNLSYDLGKLFTIGANINYVSQKQNAENDDAYSNNSTGAFNQWFHRNVDMNILKELRGYSTLVGGVRTLASWNKRNPTSYSASSPADFYKGNYWYNPFSYFDNIRNDFRRDRVFGDINLTYKLNNDIRIRGAARKTYVATNQSNTTNYIIETSALQTGARASYSTGYTYFNDDRYELVGTYNKKITDYTIDFLAGAETVSIRSSSLSANTRNGLYIPDFFSLNNSIDPIAQANSRSQEKRRAIFTRGSLGWRNMIFGEFTLRNDWFSTLPKDKNAIFTKSFGASFVFSDLVKEATPWLSYGKVRASFGEVPQALGPYNLELNYGVGQDQFNGNFLMSTPNSIVNPEIQGAVRTTTEVGADLRFIKSRFGLSATYYWAQTKNSPIAVQINGASGFTSKLVNAGRIDQEGIDLQLSANLIRTNNFSYVANAAFSKIIKNTVVELAPGVDQINVSSGASFGGITTPRVVHQVGEQWGMLIGGGKKYDNGVPVLNPDGTFVKEENVKFGSVLPEFTGGLQNTFTYKDFTLNVNIDYQYGGKFFSLSDMWGSYSGLLARTAALNDRGFPIRDNVADGGGVHVVGVTADKAVVDRYVDAQTYFHSMVSNNVFDDFIYDLTFVKLRELSLGYRIPVQKWSGVNKYIQGATFSLVSRNPVLIYAKTRDFDPSEIANVYGENGQLPGTRSFGFNLKLNF